MSAGTTPPSRICTGRGRSRNRTNRCMPISLLRSGGGRTLTLIEPDGGTRLRRRLGTGGHEVELPPTHVVPRANLPSDPAVDTDGLEAEALVDRDARLVGQRDARTHDVEPLTAQQVEQRGVERAPDATAPLRVIDVDR